MSVQMVEINAQFVKEENLLVRIPISNKKFLVNLPGPIYRENLKNDSLDLIILPSQLQSIQSQYPGLKVIPAAAELDDSDMARDLTEALSFTKYPTYYQYDSMMHYFVNNYPSICMIDTFGFSVEGRLLLAIKISDNVHEEEDEPAFLYTATMHGDELIGYILSLRLIDFILSSYGSNPEIDRIVNDVEIWINPLANPDYTYYGTNSSVANSTRPYFPDDYLNLNRGFPDPSAGDKNDTTDVYLENQYMMLFMMEKKFNLSANIHSGAEVVNYPWDYKFELHPDDEWYKFISREYADEAHVVNPNYMDDFQDGISNGADWYVINGGRQDYVNHYLQGRELTLELSNIKKLASESLESYWNYNQWSLINMISQASYGIHGNVSDKNSGKSLQAKIWIQNHDDESSRIESDSVSGNFYRYLKEGIYTLIVSANGYVADTIHDVEVIDYLRNKLNIQMLWEGTGIKEVFMMHPDIFPNPASEIVSIRFGNNSFHSILIQVYNTMGSLIYIGDCKAERDIFNLNVSEFDSGCYLIQITTGDQIYRHKLLIY
ncbi:M14 family zinc carboxypeptidase [Bacteroidota bacterium]